MAREHGSYYHYYAAFNAPRVGHKDDESQARVWFCKFVCSCIHWQCELSTHVDGPWARVACMDYTYLQGADTDKTTHPSAHLHSRDVVNAVQDAFQAIEPRRVGQGSQTDDDGPVLASVKLRWQHVKTI